MHLCKYCNSESCDCNSEECLGCSGCFIPDEPQDMTDVEADADTLRSAGMGTDEDYGDYGYDPSE